MLRAGALPAPLQVIEERTVGPDLGQDAIEMGLITGLIGFGLVFAFMIALYGAWGMLANTALLLNVVLTFSALSLLGATLTLPGIAGIVLGIGRSEEHTSELQSLMRTSYAVFCLQKTNMHRHMIGRPYYE